MQEELNRVRNASGVWKVIKNFNCEQKKNCQITEVTKENGTTTKNWKQMSKVFKKLEVHCNYAETQAPTEY